MSSFRTLAVVMTAALALTGSAFAQTVDDVVALHLTSRGGADKWRSIQTQRLTGTVHTQGVELGMVTVGRRPNLGRQELTLDIPGQGPVAIVNVFDGSKAWTINPMLGATTAMEVTGRDGDVMRDQSEMESPLIDYRRKGYTIDSIGIETVGDRKAHHLRVSRPDRPVSHYFIDAETGVELRIATDVANAPTVEFTDHRQVDGVLVPFRIAILQDGQLQAEVIVTSVEFNVPVNDALFTKP